LSTAYILRESFDQLWDLQIGGLGTPLFDSWKAQLRWQRLKPYQTFAEMIERHWDGIAAYCRPEKQDRPRLRRRPPTQIRVLQRRAYGLRDENISS